MRILAIGLGGAGCRIANALYANDRRSSKVTCVQALAVDIDGETLAQLQGLPEQAKIGFTAVEPDFSRQASTASRHTTIEIGEIIGRIQNLERGETDAILICCGLGGMMTDVAPHLISALRASVTEPIFGLVTLPTLSEGEKRSAKAADDIDNIVPLLDGTILFDNETWLKKIAARRDVLVAEQAARGQGLFGFGKNQPKLSAQDITYKLLNQSIIRRISIILRAGEFRADGGIDLAEVVMDSSEVLNTIKGMGFIAIGYAVEHLSQGPMAFLSRLRTADATMEQRKSAERIIELAKQAIYQEVSIPCDMTSAAKALILVAGPSHEISMKGIMTVRKWIDRSIAGMEMRSGDYPVTNSEYVAIIVVLSGLENIPRITEIREIREQYQSGVSRGVPGSLNLPPATGLRKAGAVSEAGAGWGGTELRDDMISLPGGRTTKRAPDQDHAGGSAGNPGASLKPAQPLPSVVPAGSRPQAVRPRILEERGTATEMRVPPPSPEQQESFREPALSRGTARVKPTGPAPQGTPVHRYTLNETPAVPSPKPGTPPPVRRSLESGYEGSLPLKHTMAKSRDVDHQKIDRALQRQRMIPTSENPDTRETPVIPVRTPIPAQPETKTIIRRVTAKAPVRGPVSPGEPAVTEKPSGERTIIRIRKKERGKEDVWTSHERSEQTGPVHQEELDLAVEMDDFSVAAPLEETKIGVKDRLQPARDDIFLGKSVSLKKPFQVKDEALLHTDIKTKKGRPGSQDEGAAEERQDFLSPAKKKTGKSAARDDEIS
ncbi:MAG: cell division protein [Methanoregula sp.]|uniref:tubulin/FtsZ family protein n=1 Tax=Methanoregula sp. TaxID=2052170 RepID=UPI003FD6F9BC